MNVWSLEDITHTYCELHISIFLTKTAPEHTPSTNINIVQYATVCPFEKISLISKNTFLIISNREVVILYFRE